VTLLCKALETLVKKEFLALREKANLIRKHKVSIFTAGPAAQAFYKDLLDNWGVEAKFFIDNDPVLEKSMVCGKQILGSPWKNLPEFYQEYAVIIATSFKNYWQIARQLDEIGFTRYMHYDAFIACKYWDCYERVVELLEDDLSKVSYLAAIYALLTDDIRFIQYIESPYFAIKGFIRNGPEIIVDAGAFVGDTVEEYLRRGLIGLKIYAFEPGSDAIAALRARVERLKIEWALKDDDIIIIQAGLGEKTEIINLPLGCDAMLRKSNDGPVKEIQIYSLDDFFSDRQTDHLRFSNLI
jgi:hypothetical protein